MKHFSSLADENRNYSWTHMRSEHCSLSSFQMVLSTALGSILTCKRWSLLPETLDGDPLQISWLLSLHFPLVCSENSSLLVFPGFLAPLPKSREFSRLYLGSPLPIPWLRYSPKAIPWDNHRAHLISFPLLRGHCTCLECSVFKTFASFVFFSYCFWVVSGKE